MGFNVKNKKGNIDAKQSVKNSEVDKETLDFNVENEEGDITAEQNIDGVKSKKTITYIVVAITTALVSIAGYYFAQEKETKSIEQLEQQIQQEINPIENDSIVNDSI